jgi:hypothetical protein
MVVVGSHSVLFRDSWAQGLGRLGSFLTLPQVLNRIFNFYILGKFEKMLQVKCESRTSGIHDVYHVD